MSAVLADLSRLRDQPPPSDPAAGGCSLASVAIILIVLMPFVGQALDLSGSVMARAGAALALTALVGGLVGLLGGGMKRGALSREVESAIEDLVAAYPDGDELRRRRAAVLILDRAFMTVGPTTTSSFDPDLVKERLGETLPYVERIERMLVERNEIYPVFISRS